MAKYIASTIFTVMFFTLFSCSPGENYGPGDGEEEGQEDTTDQTGDVQTDGTDPLQDGDVPTDGAEDAIGDDGVPDITDATDADAEPEVIGECDDLADCAGIYGPAPCGAWECNSGQCEVNCPGCTDADRDGYGTGTCAGPDCDDADDAVFDAAVRSCYSGPSGTAGVGTCLAGTETCAAGAWSPCVGEVVPSGEACNDQDDDCDGTVDEDLGNFTCGVGNCVRTVAACTGGAVGVCVPGSPAVSDPCGGGDEDCDGAVDDDCLTCVPVALNGDDTTADGSKTFPFQTIQAAINWAAADSTHPRIVCVAAGTACGRIGTYAGAVTMADGISVYGNYESTGWTRCSNSTTVIQTGTPVGVLFPSSVTNPTTLDGFQVDRHSSSTTSAVTVNGAHNAILSNIVISNTPSVTNSYGVSLLSGAEALIVRSSIFAGSGTSESYGIVSVGSVPTIRNNCQGYDAAGRCSSFCGSSGASIRGRFTSGTGVTYGVFLKDSPGAVIDASAICGNDADTGAGIRIEGDGTGILVRASLVNAWGGDIDSHGIWMEGCGGAAPWIVDNYLIASAGDLVTTRVDGIRAIGDCHPVIDSNLLIAGGSEGGTVGANGVYCGADTAGTASACVVLGNLLVEGSQYGYPPTSVGVRCDDDGCMRIADNVITGRGGMQVWGVWLGESGTFVDNNQITGGCGITSAVGVYTENSFARLQNNRIFAGACNTGASSTAPFIGLQALVSAGTYEIDVNSNDIDGQGDAMPCTSTGVQLDITGTAPTGGVGIFRNNIIRGGDCLTAVVFQEANVSADPRIFENNDLDPYSAPGALYIDETTALLGTAAAVNALTDMTVGGIISADAMYVSYPGDLHIQTGSPCDGAGTLAGAPASDMDGDLRSLTAPDIGADEI